MQIVPNYPSHIPTYKAALKGIPLSKGRWLSRGCSKKKSLYIARGAMFCMILREQKKEQEQHEMYRLSRQLLKTMT